MTRNHSVAGTSVIQCGWRCSTTCSSFERIFSGYATLTSWDRCPGGYRFPPPESGGLEVFDVAGADGLRAGGGPDDQAPRFVHVDGVASDLPVVGQGHPDGTTDRRAGRAVRR